MFRSWWWRVFWTMGACWVSWVCPGFLASFFLIFFLAELFCLFFFPRLVLLLLVVCCSFVLGLKYLLYFLFNTHFTYPKKKNMAWQKSVCFDAK